MKSKIIRSKNVQEVFYENFHARKLKDKLQENCTDNTQKQRFKNAPPWQNKAER